MKKEEVEPGVRRMRPPKDHFGNQHGDVFLYNLDEMSEDSIAKYGLSSAYERYKAGKVDATSI